VHPTQFLKQTAEFLAMVIEKIIIDLRASRTYPALPFETMLAVISDAMQIIEVIQAVRKCFNSPN
jgi:hypothetical protein